MTNDAEEQGFGTWVFITGIWGWGCVVEFLLLTLSEGSDARMETRAVTTRPA